MRSTARRSAILALLLPLIATLVLPSDGAVAAPRVSVKVTAHRSVASVPVGRTARITGNTNRGRRGDVVQLERQNTKGWQRVARSRVSSARRFTFTVKPPAGRTAYRVVRPATRGLARGVSGTVRITGVRSVRLSAHPSTKKTLAGRRIAFAGSVSAGKAGDPVRLQRKDGKGWRTVGSARLSAKRTYALSTRVPAGNTRYRVLRPATTGYRQAVSAPYTISAASCTPMTRPRGITPWGTDPTVDRTSSMTIHLSRLFCSVAPRSRVRVAMFLISSAREPGLVLRSLRAAHKYLGVKVEILVERRPIGVIPAKDVAKLRQFASVYMCDLSCHSDFGVSAVMHDKFVTISDMNWAGGKDPALWSSSANWSKKQLRGYWQSGLLIYGNRQLTREFDARYEGMRGCALHNRRCGSWAPSVNGARLPAAFAKVKVGPTWYDKGLTWRSGDRGDGTRVLFSPTASRVDPVLQQLDTYSCRPGHRTVRFSIYRMSVGRGTRIIKALQALRARGCDVRAIYNIGGSKVIDTEAPHMLAAAGIPRTCVRNNHDKFAYFDVVDRATGKPRRILWTGSQNLVQGGLVRNDDTLLIHTAELATGHWAADIRQTSSWYLRRWSQVAKHPTSCVWPTTTRSLTSTDAAEVD